MSFSLPSLIEAETRDIQDPLESRAMDMIRKIKHYRRKCERGSFSPLAYLLAFFLRGNDGQN